MNTDELLEAQGVKAHLCATSVFQDFNDLALGEEMTLNIDHEPVDLYQQFEEKFHDQFSWHYIEKGPDVWFVSIIKTGRDMVTVGDILCEHPKAFTIFRKHNIDACCQGNVLFSDACADAGISVATFMKEMEAAEDGEDTYIRVSEWPLDFLIEYLIINHHKFIKEKTEAIFSLLRNLQNEEEDIDPLVFQINLIFINVHDALKNHIKYEEEVVFPEICNLFRSGLPPKNLPFEFLKNSFKTIKDENSKIIATLSHIRNMTKNHLPDSTQGGMKLLYKELNNFEQDLYYHLHLEHNILFPKAIFLEEEANIWND